MKRPPILRRRGESALSIEAAAPRLPGPRTAGNENTGLLKGLAILFMIADHLGASFFPQYRELRVIGRIAFPLFAWCAVVGCCYTRNIWRYALRLLLVGSIAQPCYMLGLVHTWKQLNVFATLLCGVLAIAGIRERRLYSHIWAPVLAILLSCVLEMDYGWKGVALLLILYGCRERKAAIAAGMTAFCLFWAGNTFRVTSFLGVPLPQSLSFLPRGGQLLSTMTQVQFFAIFALPLILIPMRKRWTLPKWFFYAAYPVHLLVIALFRYGAGITEQIRSLIP